MTALKEVRTTEEEAEQAIVTAKKEVAADIAAAQKAGREKKVAEMENFKKIEEEAINNQEQKIAKKVKAIESETQTEVATVEKRFTEKEAELKALLTEQL